MQVKQRIFNNRMTMVAALVFLAALGLTAAMRSSAVAQGDVERAVRDVLLQNATGFEKGDLATLNKVWANDEAVTVFESGHANYGWADYRDHHLVPELKDFKNTKYTLSDIRIKVAGKTAWATFKYALTGQFKDRAVDVNGLGTAVLEERGGNWLIVHWHTSAPRRAPAATPPAKKG